MDMHRLKADFEQGYKYDELAKKYDISKGTISKYKKKYGWKRNKKHNVETKRKQVSNKVSKVKLNKHRSTDDKWKQFCLVYLRKHNATQAYLDVYDCSYDTAATNGPALLRNTQVKSYLDELRAAQANELYLSALDVQREQAKIAFANLADYLTAKHIRKYRQDLAGDYIVDVDGKPIIDEYDELILTNPEKADWSIISEVHRGKDGLVVKLYDKQKALDFLAKSLPDTAQARIDKAKADSLDTDNNEQMNSIDNLLNKIEGADANDDARTEDNEDV